MLKTLQSLLWGGLTDHAGHSLGRGEVGHVLTVSVCALVIIGSC